MAVHIYLTRLILKRPQILLIEEVRQTFKHEQNSALSMSNSITFTSVIAVRISMHVLLTVNRCLT